MSLLRWISWLLLAQAGVTSAHAATPIALCEAIWHDPLRNRSVPVRIRMPAGKGKVAVVLFSHGLGGSLDAGTIWANAWAEAGFAVINLQHPGTDSSIFGKSDFRSLFGSEQLVVRARDVQFVLDELGRRAREGVCDLSRTDPLRIGLAGHSFGAQTVQAVAGQSFPTAHDPPLTDPRVRAAVALSPSPPIAWLAQRAFASIAIPFLSITGTADAVPSVLPISAIERQQPFRLMPPGDKYLLVINGGTHAMFAGQSFAMQLNGSPPPKMRDTVVAITTGFWRAFLDNDASSLRWLREPAKLRAELPPGDTFEVRLLSPDMNDPSVPFRSVAPYQGRSSLTPVVGPK